MTTAISIENLSKVYRLGLVGSGTLRDDLHRWWTLSVRGKPDPLMKIGNIDHGNRDGDRVWALRNVDLQVEQGEIIGIIGRNGAGKSTLLKILSRVTGPTDGRLRIRGTLTSMLEVGTGFQPEMTGRENVFLQGSVLGLRREEVEQRYDDIVAFSEIEHFMETPVKRYSSGMFVRLAFAVSAHLRADIMIVDEVLGVGDVGFQRKCIDRMKEIAVSGRTILFVSHRMDHIHALCSRAILLDKGRKIGDGAVQEVTNQYFTLFKMQDRKSLNLRQDRKGRGRVRFVDAWMENERGEKTDRFETSRPLKLVLLLENRTSEPVRNLYVTAAVNTIENMVVGSISTKESKLAPLEIDRVLRVEFTVDSLPLNYGHFYFNCNVQTALGGYEYDDLIENAGIFEVTIPANATMDKSIVAFAELSYSTKIETDGASPS